ncbi:MAG: class I SAM-dependent methyltransferase [Bacteroidaceae bacterium]|nr:class I SAM-dependent methyltransferase [Bacteroidaceae bacterium]
MQDRHENRKKYFYELATTSKEYFIPYIQKYKCIKKGMQVLEIGCGEGGNLLPFAQMGCHTLGIDLAKGRIDDANRFFSACHAEGRFISSDIFNMDSMFHSFDIVICHDVMEHIADKQRLISLMENFLSPDGVLFVSFPAWQMPFGGHQQICRGKVVSHLPFIHLLPKPVYRKILSKESTACIRELLSIRDTRTTVEMFEKLVLASHSLQTVNRTLFLINPHYKVKFGMRPRKLSSLIGNVPWLRNFFTSSCFYLCSVRKQR